MATLFRGASKRFILAPRPFSCIQRTVSTDSANGTESLGDIVGEAQEEMAWLQRMRQTYGAQASQFLSPPGDDSRLRPGLVPHSPPATLEDFLKDRAWDYDATPVALRLLSQALSFPLTIAHLWPTLMQGRALEDVRLGVLGARSEAMLPLPYWRELLVAAPPHVRRIELVMIGPEVMGPQTPPTPTHTSTSIAVQARGGSAGPGEVVLTRQAGLFHHVVQKQPSLLREVSAWVLFNPGLGHPAQSQHWAQTLSLLTPPPSDASPPDAGPSPERKGMGPAGGSASQPILLTAHSARDCERDMHHLTSARGFEVEWLCRPGPNPFANRRRSLDPLDRTHVVAANHSAGVMRLRGRSTT